MSRILQWILTRTWKRNVLNPASVMNTHIWIVLMIQHVNIYIFSSENRFCLLLYPYYIYEIKACSTIAEENFSLILCSSNLIVTVLFH